LDKLKIKEAYDRLIDVFGVYISEKDLKAQNEIAPSAKVKKNTMMPIPEEPEMIAYLPKTSHSNFTLVVDLDETLVHYAEIPGSINELRVRPYVHYFLTELSQLYDVVVFTAATQEYADWALNLIDRKKCVNHRLYRHHATVEGLNYVKDLSKLGRDLSKIIIIDNLAENFKLQPDNGIYIKPWYDDPDDTALAELTPILTEIARKNVKDVRVALKKFREQMIKNIEDGIENPHLHLKLD
jgi:CTD small phosphatase-like protein 2